MQQGKNVLSSEPQRRQASSFAISSRPSTGASQAPTSSDVRPPGRSSRPRTPQIQGPEANCGAPEVVPGASSPCLAQAQDLDHGPGAWPAAGPRPCCRAASSDGRQCVTGLRALVTTGNLTIWRGHPCPSLGRLAPGPACSPQGPQWVRLGPLQHRPCRGSRSALLPWPGRAVQPGADPRRAHLELTSEQAARECPSQRPRRHSNRLALDD